MPTEDPVVYRFVGQPNEYVDGVPARDLTQADMDALSEEHVAAVGSSPIYEPVPPTGRRAADKEA